ncbi:putative reverse transcriptase domain, reverse transcriptase zinc-binding domain protein [Tanacetum coccineum]
MAKKVQVVGLEGVREDLQSQTKHISQYSPSFQDMQTQLQDMKDLLESAVIIDETAEGEKNQKDTNAIPAPTQGEHKTAENITPPEPSPKTQGELAYKESTLPVPEIKDDDDLDKQPLSNQGGAYTKGEHLRYSISWCPNQGGAYTKGEHLQMSKPLRLQPFKTVKSLDMAPVRGALINREAINVNTKSNQTPSFVDVVQEKSSKKVVKISKLHNDEVVEEAAIVIPLVAVEEDFFLFQFDTKEGMDNVIESGPWLIHGVPLFLNVWNPSTFLKKDEIKNAPIWVKLHHVPIGSYSVIGLSLITTQIGKPMMMDSYTSSVCVSSWGRNTYIRNLIDMSGDKDLLESIVISIPKSKGEGHTLATIEIEYEWRPPHCSICKLFEHMDKHCPTIPKETEPVLKTNMDDFTKVKRRKRNGKKSAKPRQIDGVRMSKPPPSYYYHRVEKGESFKANDENKLPSPKLAGISKTSMPKPNEVTLENFVASLNEEGDTDLGDEATWMNLNRMELDKVQTDLDAGPFNSVLREEEAAYVQAFNDALVFVVKGRVSRSRIDVVTNADGIVFENENVVNAFVDHYELFLGNAGNTTNLDTSNLFQKKLDDATALAMIRGVSARKVKEAMFSMGNDKSPRSDGYTAEFFKDVWDIMGNNVTKAELMHNYHLDRGVPRCAFKVDIQKAYDTVDLEFIRQILGGFGFHDRMITWIMECVTSTSFSPSINDDMFLFAYGDTHSTRVIMESLDEFKLVSGLIASLPKSSGMRKGKAKVAWEIVCLPKEEGGLGIRRLYLFNKALMTSHIWKLLSLKESLWVGFMLIRLRTVIFRIYRCEVMVRDTPSGLIVGVQVVWANVKVLAGLQNSGSSFNSNVSIIRPLAKRRTSLGVIAKLVFAASAYFIWQERNGRLFKKTKRSTNQVVECVMTSFRLKLLLCRFKKSRDSSVLMWLWNIRIRLFNQSDNYLVLFLYR